MEDSKTRMSRKEPMDGNNSIFHLDALCVTNVWEAKPWRTVKYEYNVLEKRLTVLGDVEHIYILYKR